MAAQKQPCFIFRTLDILNPKELCGRLHKSEKPKGENVTRSSCTADKLKERALSVWMVKAMLLCYWSNTHNCILLARKSQGDVSCTWLLIWLGTLHKCAKVNYLPCREMIIHMQKHIKPFLARNDCNH